MTKQPSVCSFTPTMSIPSHSPHLQLSSLSLGCYSRPCYAQNMTSLLKHFKSNGKTHLLELESNFNRNIILFPLKIFQGFLTFSYFRIKDEHFHQDQIQNLVGFKGLVTIGQCSLIF